MSMDNTFEQMQAFERSLARFQELLSASMQEMADRHADLDPLWESDELRRSYEAQYIPLRQMLERYCMVHGPEYLDFLRQKLRAIGLYLHGRG